MLDQHFEKKMISIGRLAPVSGGVRLRRRCTTVRTAAGTGLPVVTRWRRGVCGVDGAVRTVLAGNDGG